MPQNKPFTPDEDRIIIYLYDELKIKQWSLVAKKMTEDFNLERNAKQCRDRYRQVLDPYSNPEWNQMETKELYRLHNEIGNKWALIASHFSGKTDNYVKNQFYSKIRKALRHLNKVIKANFKKEFKQIKIAAIYKIIQGFQQQFKEKPIVTQEISNQCCVLKDALLSLADQSQQLQDRMEQANVLKERYLIQKIVEFNRTYKKKSKKEKRESLQVQQLFKPAKKIQLIMSNQNQVESEFQGVNSVASSDSEEAQHCIRVIKEDSMKQQRDELRRSPVYVIVQEDDRLRDSPNSARSKIQIRMHDLMSGSGKMEEEDNNQSRKLFGLRGSQNQNTLSCFGLIRGSSCFRSYQSHSETQKSKTDMFEQVRISNNLKQLCSQMQAQREQNIFRSQQ